MKFTGTVHAVHGDGDVDNVLAKERQAIAKLLVGVAVVVPIDGAVVSAADRGVIHFDDRRYRYDPVRYADHSDFAHLLVGTARPFDTRPAACHARQGTKP